MRQGRLAMLLTWPFDRGVRKATKSFLGAILRNPFRLFQRSYIQSIMFIQPVDCMADGGQSMCDGCPDITVWEDKLVWSCRLEELKSYGDFLRTVPKQQSKPDEETTTKPLVLDRPDELAKPMTIDEPEPTHHGPAME